ncbi:hypothetical protein DL766_008873 [Monosporascus sp. MC13-8B]|uniref:Ribosomal protein L28 n=1 Tax=Monosporascus cannonballus TaxID=155416 RepID=A0ABY0GVR7_9PEZI|nr:hypothetical protein DL762_008907 [Monosporascus cannonballus]RYO92464.1 hypothetical protein DL763_004691 [Monosporascus cannonballus]RYP17598.1 hypothetical protein DL766_008873 [Monosporascus sp. MC13-8B]
MPSLRPLAAPQRCLAASLAIYSTPATTTFHASRAFGSTPRPGRQTPSHLTVPADQIPAYPYGPFRTYKQRNEGLFGRAKIRFGNTVSERYDRKSRTSWLPNRHAKRLWSPALGAFVRTRLTAQVLRTIDRLGGIDEYLLGSKSRRVRELGPAGWALRWKIMQTPAVRARFAREREALGLPPKEEERAAGGAAVHPELVGEDGRGMTAEAMGDLVDGMIARDEEFVLGEVTEAERAAAARHAAEAELAGEAEHVAEVERATEPEGSVEVDIEPGTRTKP